MLRDVYYIFPETKTFIDKTLVDICAREEVSIDQVVLICFWFNKQWLFLLAMS